MYCKNCGAKITEDSKYCMYCGEQAKTPAVTDDVRRPDYTVSPRIKRARSFEPHPQRGFRPAEEHSVKDEREEIEAKKEKQRIARAQQKGTNALILGICSIALSGFLCFISGLFNLLSLGIGISAVVTASNAKKEGATNSVPGTVTGVIGIVISVLSIGYYLIARVLINIF